MIMILEIITLDLILTNELLVQDEVHIMAPVDNSDHNVLILEMDCTTNKAQSNKKKICYNPADFNGMRQFVRRKLEDMDSTDVSASILWDTFNGVTQEAIKRFVPVCTVDDKKETIVDDR